MKEITRICQEWGVLLELCVLWRLRTDWSTRRLGPAMTSLRERVEEARTAEESQKLED